jgi:hypothetical protein
MISPIRPLDFIGRSHGGAVNGFTGMPHQWSRSIGVSPPSPHHTQPCKAEDGESGGFNMSSSEKRFRAISSPSKPMQNSISSWLCFKGLGQRWLSPPLETRCFSPGRSFQQARSALRWPVGRTFLPVLH